jgi:signal transduction histidine kinase
MAAVPAWARVAIVVAGLAFALGAELVRLAAGWPLPWVIGDIVPGVAFLLCGLLAWQRRPDSRIGPLMIATGFTWFVGTYGASTDPVTARLAYGFQGWFEAFLAWLVLAYPTGHMRSAASRVVLGLFFGLLAVRAVVRLLVFRLSTDYDLSQPAEVDRFIADGTFRDAVAGLFEVAIAALAVAVIVLVIARLRTESALGRRVAGPILLGGGAFTVAIVVDVIALASASSFAERSVVWDVRALVALVTGLLVPMGFLLGMTRSHLARSAVADLVVELGVSQNQSAVRDVVARALRDPSLEIAYAHPDQRGFTDLSGAPIELPAPGDGRRAVTRLDVGGRIVAALIHDPALVEQPELVRSVAAAAGLALENERLAADVRAQLQEVGQSRARIVAAGDAERRRIERDIHDGAQQRLVTLALMLQVARSRVAKTDPDLGTALADASAELESALAELRRLARGLHPAVLEEEGLAAAVEALTDRIPVPVSVRATPRRFTPEVETAAYFVVSEALTNVVKHANASSVCVNLDERDEVLLVTVTDDGAGGAASSPGSGLAGLGDRVAAAGGRLVVESPIGRGTIVRAEIPCA